MGKDSSSSVGGKQSTLLSFFSKTPAPPSSSPSTSQVTKLKPKVVPKASMSTTASASSPLVSKTAPPESTPIAAPKKKIIVEEDDNEISEVPGLMESTPSVMSTKASSLRTGVPSSDTVDVDVDMQSDDSDEEFPVQTRKNKRPLAYFEESEQEDDASNETAAAKKSKTTTATKKKTADDDDEDYDFGDEDAFVVAAAEFDDFVVDDDVSEDERPQRKKTASSKSTSSSAKAKSSAGASRPPPRPTGSNNNSSGSNFLLTQAERSKLDEKAEKREKEDCFDFLVDLKDKEGHKPDHPDYDPRTIRIPGSAWAKFTPFEKQFWEIKQNHYDTVLFFQKGKFYELYENDAAIGNREFNLKLTDRVKMKMVGVPEQSFDMWAAKFLAAGYKVGRVEQAETALAVEMRNKGKTGGDKIVRRELRNVLTNGTVSDATFLTSDEESHCIAIIERSNSPNEPSSYGISILEASTGTFQICELDDDICRTKLETLFRQLKPKELIHPKGNLSLSTLRTLRSILPSSCVWSALKPGKEFLEADTTLLALKNLFAGTGNQVDEMDVDGNEYSNFPPAIKQMLGKELAISSLGGLVTYLNQLNLDKELVSQRNFDVYSPMRYGQSLVLDGQTLAHIEVLVNNEGGDEGSLLQLLQRCVTPYGKRLFRIWLCMPLLNVKQIDDRLDAVQDLMDNVDFMVDFKKMVKGLPDLERLISRIHAKSCSINEFIKVMESFKTLQMGVKRLASQAEGFASNAISALLDGAPDLKAHLSHVNTMFDYDGGILTPTSGTDEAYDECAEEISGLENQLEELRDKYEKDYKGIEFWNSSIGTKDIYLLAVSTKHKVPKNWNKVSSTKTINRYYTPETQPLVRSLQEARESRNQAVRAFIKRLYAEFDEERLTWLKMVKAIAELDCLIGLALASRDLDEPKCRPNFVDAPQSFVDFKDLRHPSMCLRNDFIPNDVQMGGDNSRTILLTGPNMAGKSTLLRMTAAGVIMAQLGMMVPAAEATLSPIDKIQTRMGAYDNMFTNSSTFKVELDECAKILRDAGPRSLVILDELGRGTSTYDGMAIAGAVLHHIATHTQPLGFFATHYGTLTDEYAYHPNIRSMHMKTHVDEEKREVTFLYKLIGGAASSSHGTHVAHLAGVDISVVTRAESISRDFYVALQKKLTKRRRSALPIVAHADFAFLFKLATSDPPTAPSEIAAVLRGLRKSVGRYDVQATIEEELEGTSV